MELYEKIQRFREEWVKEFNFQNDPYLRFNKKMPQNVFDTLVTTFLRNEQDDGGAGLYFASEHISNNKANLYFYNGIYYQQISLQSFRGAIQMMCELVNWTYKTTIGTEVYNQIVDSSERDFYNVNTAKYVTFMNGILYWEKLSI